MNVAVLMEPGRYRLTAPSQRAVVLAVIASLHVLIVYLLVNYSQDSSIGHDTVVIQAGVIPAERKVPDPPSYPPVVFQAASSIELPLVRVAIDLPTEQPAAAIRATDTLDLKESPKPPVAKAVADADPGPVVRPRPISGPRGADRYPNESMRAKETGTVGVSICVSPAGTVDSVELARSSGFPRLDHVALGIASEYRFQPATRAGRPVAACLQYNIVFKLT